MSFAERFLKKYTDEAYQAGREKGYEIGKEIGRKLGYKQGREEGYAAGYREALLTKHDSLIHLTERGIFFCKGKDSDGRICIIGVEGGLK